MNWDQIEGKWKQMKGAAKKQWGKLTDDDLEYMSGSKEQFVGRLQERYGIAKEEAQQQADQWLQAQAEKEGPPLLPVLIVRAARHNSPE